MRDFFATLIGTIIFLCGFTQANADNSCNGIDKDSMRLTTQAVFEAQSHGYDVSKAIDVYPSWLVPNPPGTRCVTFIISRAPNTQCPEQQKYFEQSIVVCFDKENKFKLISKFETVCL